MKQLETHPETGLLRAQRVWTTGGPALVQHWRSFEHLDRFARDPRFPHCPPGTSGCRLRGSRAPSASGTRPTRCTAGEYEAVYGNMPRTGLARVGTHVPIAMKGRTAARRIGATEADIPARDPAEDPTSRA